MVAPTSTTLRKEAEPLYAALLGSGFPQEQSLAVVGIAHSAGMEEALLRDVQALKKAKDSKDLPTLAKRAQDLAETVMDAVERGGDPAKLGAALTALTGDKDAGKKLEAAVAGKKKSDAANEILHPTRNADGTPASPDSPPVYSNAERQQALKDWDAGRDASKAALAALTAELTEGLFAASRGAAIVTGAAVKPDAALKPVAAAATKLKIVMAPEGSGIESNRPTNAEGIVVIGEKDQPKLAGFMKARGLSDVAAAYELMEKEFNTKRKVSTGTQTKPADMFAAYNDKGELDGPQRVQTVAPAVAPAPAPAQAPAPAPHIAGPEPKYVREIGVEGGSPITAEMLQKAIRQKNPNADLGKTGGGTGIDGQAGQKTMAEFYKTFRNDTDKHRVDDAVLTAKEAEEIRKLAAEYDKARGRGAGRTAPAPASRAAADDHGHDDHKPAARVPAPAPAQAAPRTAKGKIEGADIIPIAASLKDANQEVIAETMRKALAAYEGETALEKVRKFQAANNMKQTGVVGPEEFGKAGMQLAMQGMKQEPAVAAAPAPAEETRLTSAQAAKLLSGLRKAEGVKGETTNVPALVVEFQQRENESGRRLPETGRLDAETSSRILSAARAKFGTPNEPVDQLVADASKVKVQADLPGKTRVASAETQRGS